ncbi:hypothetical protein PENSPDRAFT_491168 [Peniophora sp. CONT]|nr:hypothetical protein PENSPDRAFT_491168 [Peniophora sp. CONT]
MCHTSTALSLPRVCWLALQAFSQSHIWPLRSRTYALHRCLYAPNVYLYLYVSIIKMNNLYTHLVSLEHRHAMSATTYPPRVARSAPPSEPLRSSRLEDLHSIYKVQ